MSKIGDRLKTKRLQKKLTLEDVYQLTKIRPSLIRQIENNEFSEASIFHKAKIKNYAKCLGVAYTNTIIPAPLTKAKKPLRSVGTYFSFLKNQRQFLKLGLLVLILVFFWNLSHLTQKTEESRLALKKPSLEVEKKASLKEAIVTGQFHKELIFISKKNLNVYFKVDQKSTETRMLKMEQPLIIKARHRIFVRIDESALLEMTYNGKKQLINSPFEKLF